MSLSGTGFFTSGVPDRVFDTKRSGLIGNAADMLFQIVPSSGLGGVVEMYAGNDANVFASFPNILHQSGFDINQAYLSWTNSPGNFTIIGGKFVTLAGAEVIRITNDLNYSHSILFGYAIPFSHTGVRASYTLSPKATIYAGINRGWDKVVGTNGDRTYEGALALTPSSTTTLNINGYTGTEQIANTIPNTAQNGTRNLIDLVAGWKPPGPVAWMANYDYGSQANAALINGAGVQTVNAAGTPLFGNTSWNGLAGYATYTISPKFAVTLRGEYFNDTNGYRTGIAQTWNEGTLTLAVTPNANFLVRAEVRSDSSNQPSFITSTTGTSGKGQNSVAVEGVLKF